MSDEVNQERLDSPLIVHKESDASYQETATEVTMNATHSDDDSDVPTLERHRFKKNKKKRKWHYVLLVFIAVAVAVLLAFKYSGAVDFSNKEAATQAPSSRVYVTEPENKFEGVIVVKGHYIFFEGEELDGLEELEKSIKYLDKGTSFKIWNEDADSDFLNFEVLTLLTRYDIKYEIEHKVSTGLVSKYENNVQQAPTDNVQSSQTGDGNV